MATGLCHPLGSSQQES